MTKAIESLTFTKFQKSILYSFIVALLFCASLAQTITYASLPTIAGNLSVNIIDAAWVVTCYPVASAIVVLISTWLMETFGRVSVFLVATMIFGAASYGCGVSTTLTELVIYRTLQGIGGGAIFRISQSFMFELSSHKNPARSLMVWGLISMTGTLTGPTLGGWLSTDNHWALSFFINIPVALFSLPFIFVWLMPFENPRLLKPFDVAGFLLFSIAICSLQIVLDQGYQLDWWRSHFIISMSVACVISFAFFIVWELFHPEPLIELRFFKSRFYSIGVFALGSAMLLLFGNFSLVARWLQGPLVIHLFGQALVMRLSLFSLCYYFLSCQRLSL